MSDSGNKREVTEIVDTDGRIYRKDQDGRWIPTGESIYDRGKESWTESKA